MEWDLSVMYAGCGAPEFAADLDRLDADLSAAHEEMDAPKPVDAARLAQIVKTLQDLRARAQCVSNMVYLTLASNAGDPDATAMSDRTLRVSQRCGLLESRFGRLVRGVQGLEEMIAAEPVLGEHAFFLRSLVEAGEHQLDEQYETQVLTMQINGGLAFARLRNELVGSATGVLRHNGREERLAMTQIERLLASPDAQMRRDAWEAQQSGYAAIEVPMTACLSGIKGEGAVLAGWKHFDSVLDWSLSRNRIDRDILEAMRGAIWDCAELLRRYFRAKAHALGHEGGLPDWDFRAPMGAASTQMTYEEAKALLKRVLGAFDPRVDDMLERAHRENWIDWSVRKGKSGDCFNTNLYIQGQSRVMVGFDGSLGSVFTMAHELGHAYHDDCLRKGSVLNCDYPMAIAETASIFNETLMFDALTQTCSDEEKLALLDRDLYSITRQTINMMGRLRFEEEIFAERERHALTPERVKALMLETQREVYADSASQLNPYLWMIGDHLFLPELHYYNFPYAFGRLFSRGLYARYLREGSAFAQKYYEFLCATGTMNVADAAAKMGVDVYDGGFWRESLESFRPMIEEFERLTAK